MPGFGSHLGSFSTLLGMGQRASALHVRRDTAPREASGKFRAISSLPFSGSEIFQRKMLLEIGPKPGFQLEIETEPFPLKLNHPRSFGYQPHSGRPIEKPQGLSPGTYFGSELGKCEPLRVADFPPPTHKVSARPGLGYASSR